MRARLRSPPPERVDVVETVEASEEVQAIDSAGVLRIVCDALLAGSSEAASSTLRSEYPFAPVPPGTRDYGPLESTRIFIRDGFIDRYGGERLVFPPVLRVISMALPSDFPYHPNWKTDVTHRAYWELSATVDHLVPVARGGSDDEANLVTTSMAHNSAKLSWTLDQLGWRLHPPGDFAVWDGLIRWFVEYTQLHPEPLDNGSVWAWYKAARAALA